MTFQALHRGTLVTGLAIQVCGLITGVLTARSLGPAERGELLAVLLWPTIFANVGMVGANLALTRAAAASGNDDSARWHRVAVVLACGLSAVSAALGVWLMPHLLVGDKAHLVTLAQIGLLLIPLDIAGQLLLASDHGRMRWRRFNAIRASFYGIYVVLVVALWATSRSSVAWFMAAFLVSHALAVLYRLALYRPLPRLDRAELDDCRRVFTAGLPFAWSTAGNLLALQIDKIVVVALLATSEVGLYAAAFTFTAPLALVGESMGLTTLAWLSRGEASTAAGRALATAYRQAIVLAVAVCVPLMLVIPVMAPALFGEAFRGAVPPAMFLAVGSALASASVVLQQGLKGINQPRDVGISHVTGALAMAAAAFALHGRFGLLGVAFANVVGFGVQTALLILAASRRLHVTPSSFVAIGAGDVRAVVHGLAPARAAAALVARRPSPSGAE
jgi:O-antigen/teichoic acid export membrane protein